MLILPALTVDMETADEMSGLVVEGAAEAAVEAAAPAVEAPAPEPAPAPQEEAPAPVVEEEVPYVEPAPAEEPAAPAEPEQAPAEEQPAEPQQAEEQQAAQEPQTAPAAEETSAGADQTAAETAEATEATEATEAQTAPVIESTEVTEEETEEKRYAVSPLYYVCPDYEVWVSFDESDKLPEFTSLNIKTYTANSSDTRYASYFTNTEKEFTAYDKTLGILYELKLTDNEGNEVIPAHPVDIEIALHGNTDTHTDEMILSSLYEKNSDRVLLVDRNYDNTGIITTQNDVITNIHIKSVNLNTYDNVLGLFALAEKEEETDEQSKLVPGEMSAPETEADAADESNTEIFKDAPYIGTVQATSLNLRAQADTEAEVLGLLDNGTRIGVLEVMDNGWSRVLADVDGEIKEGFVKTEYLTLEENVKAEEETEDSAEAAEETTEEATEEVTEEATEEETEEATEETTEETEEKADVQEGPAATVTGMGDGYAVKAVIANADPEAQYSVTVARTAVEQSDIEAIEAALTTQNEDGSVRRATVSDTDSVVILDITLYKDGEEYEPNGNVEISIGKASFAPARKTLKKKLAAPATLAAANTQETPVEFETIELPAEGVIHFTHNQGTEVLGTQNGSFTTDNFSRFVVDYTVDFETVMGTVYSVPGEGSYKLNDLLPYIIGKEGTVSDASLELIEGELVAGALYLSQGEGGEWYINSDAAFDDTYELTLIVGDEKYIVKVTDENTSSADLNNFITKATIVADKEGGVYVLKPGKTYTASIRFAEDPDGFQFDDSGVLTYTLPAGFTPDGLNSGTFSITATSHGEEYPVEGNRYEVVGNQLKIYLNTDSPNYQYVTSSAIATLDVNISGIFDQTKTQIDWGGDVKTDIKFDTDAGVSVQKSITGFDATTGTVSYSVSIKALNGPSSNIVINDHMEGNHVTINHDVRLSGATWSSDGVSYNVVDWNQNTTGFSFTIPSMNAGQEATVTYTAKLKDGYDTWEGGNTFSATPDEGSKPDKDSKDLSHYIQRPSISKTADVSNVVNGKQTITWTIVATSDDFMTLAGKTIKDTIKADSREDMHYSGNGLTIVVTDANGNSQTRTPSWASVGVTNKNSDYSWTYNVPSSDTGDRTYTITYTTEVDVSNMASDVVMNNTVEDEYDKKDGKGTVGPEGENHKATIDKSVEEVTSDKITWKVELKVPVQGLTTAKLTDYLPANTEKGLYDILDGSVNDIQIVGLDSTNERVVRTYNAPDSTNKKPGEVILNFQKKDNNGQWVDGLNGGTELRTITAIITSKNDPNWLEAAKSDGNLIKHTNTAKFRANDYDIEDSDSGSPMESSLKKVLSYSNTDDGLPVYHYNVTVTGVTGPFTIEDVFDNRLELYGDPVVKGGDQYSQEKMTSTPNPSTDTSTDGKVIFTVSDANLSKKGGGYESHYRIEYALKVKSAEALASIKADAAATSNGIKTLTNTATSTLGEDHVDVDYKYNGLTKELVNESAVGVTTNICKFRLTVNPEGFDMNPDGDTITLKDVFSKTLSIDYKTISVEPLEGATWNVSGYETTFVLPDETPIVITYDARIVGEGAIPFNNVATIGGQKAEYSNTKTVTADMGGTAGNYNVKILKHKRNELSTPLAGAVFELYYADGTPVKNNKQETVTFTTRSDGLAFVEGNQSNDGWALKKGTEYYLWEITAPDGYTLRDEATRTKYRFTIAQDDIADYENNIYHNGDTLHIGNTPLGGIEIRKSFRGASLSDDEKEKITFTITGPEGYSKTVKLSEFTNGKSYKITGLPVGDYTVVESNADVEGYSRTTSYYVGTDSTVEGESATVSLSNATEEKIVTFINKYQNDVEINPEDIQLRVQKKWYEGDEDKTSSGNYDSKSVEVQIVRYKAVLPTTTLHFVNEAGNEEISASLGVLKGAEVTLTIQNATNICAKSTASSMWEEAGRIGAASYGTSYSFSTDTYTDVYVNFQGNPGKISVTTSGGSASVSDNQYSLDTEYTGPTATLTNGTWNKAFYNLAATGEEGTTKYIYKYVVEEISEINGFKTTYQVDGGDFKETLTIADAVGEAGSHSIVIKNKSEAGSLKLTKEVQVNNGAPTTTANKALTNGTYEFTVSGVAGTATAGVTHTVKITFADGITTTYKIDEEPEVSFSTGSNPGIVEVPGLTPGQYTISESTPSNGTTLSSASRGDDNVDAVDSSKVITVTVEAGKSGDDVAPAGIGNFVNNINTGDMKIEKKVTGTTAKDKEFEFEVTLTAPNGVTLASSYSAKKNGQDTDAVSVNAGKVTGIKLKADETFEILGLPEGTKYTVTEITPPTGYAIGEHNNNSDVAITNGTEQTATMNNTYKAEGTLNFSAKKVFTNGTLGTPAFTFKLTQVTEQNSDTLVETSILASNPLTVSTTATSGTEQTVSFDTISLKKEGTTNQEGTYWFLLQEDVPSDVDTNGVKDNIKYDTTKKWIKVTVEDNGAGVLNVTKNPAVDSNNLDGTWTNEQLGSLKINKTGTVNGKTPTTANHDKIDGTYSFTIAGKEGTDVASNSAIVKITLTNGVATEAVIDGTATPANVAVNIADGIVTVSNLPIGTYTVTENLTEDQRTAGIKLTESSTNPQELVVSNVATDVQTGKFVNNIEVVTAKVVKVWTGANPPASLEVTLSNGETKTLNAGNNWTAQVDNLPKYNAEGQPIEYSWTEADLPAGYYLSNITESKDETTGIITTTLTNSYTDSYNPTTTIKGKKIWDDGGVARPASITVNLYKDGGSTPFRTATVQAPTAEDANKDQWPFEFTNLPIFNADGSVIQYTVEEVLPEGYTSVYGVKVEFEQATYIAGDTTGTIVNSGEGSQTFKITDGVNLGYIVIRHGNDFVIWTQRPATSKEIADIKAKVVGLSEQFNGIDTASGSSMSIVSGIPDTVDVGKKHAVSVYMQNGEVWMKFLNPNAWSDFAYGTIPYTYTQAGGEGGGTITNTKKTTEAHARKVWSGDSDDTTHRPETITYTLTAKVDGTELTDEQYGDLGITKTGTASKTASGTTPAYGYDWLNLPRFTEEGKEIEYSIDETLDEETAKYYSKSVVETNAVNHTWTATNTYGSTSITISGKKKMETGEAPGTYNFTLSAEEGIPMPSGAETADGVSTVTVQNNGETFTFGQINYSLGDWQNKGTAVAGDATRKTFTYKVKEVKGTQAGIVYDDTEYTVTVTVINIDGTLTVEGPAISEPSGKTVIEFTNKEVVDIDATKTWKQSNGTDISDKILNASVTLELQQKVGEGEWSKVTSTAEGEQNPQTISNTTEAKSEWKASWTNLPKYSNGTLIQYKVVETAATVGGKDVMSSSAPEIVIVDAAEDYLAAADPHKNPFAVDGVENTLPTKELEGTKVWEILGTSIPGDPVLKLTRTSAKENSEAETVKSTDTSSADLQPTWSVGDDAKSRKFKYSDLPKYDDEGYEYSYKVTEASFTVGNVTYTVTENEGVYTATPNDPTAKPFAVGVEVDEADEKTTITNTEKKDFEFKKLWKNSDGTSYDKWVKQIVVKLYRKQKGSAATASDPVVSTITISADDTGKVIATGSPAVSITVVEPEAGAEANGYSFKITDLDAFDAENQEYEYYLTEDAVADYNTSYGDADGNVAVNGTSAADGGQVINTPVIAVSLPETGGPGTKVFTLGGLVLMALSALVYIFKKKWFEPALVTGNIPEDGAQRKRGGGSRR